MAEPSRLGARIRALRRKESMTQAQLAERLGISASYLNLIEHNRRPLSASLLIKLARLFQLDLQAFAVDDEQQLSEQLMEAFGDSLFDTHELAGADIREFAATSPAVAHAVVTLYRHYDGLRASTANALTAAEEGGGSGEAGRLPSEEVNDFIQKRLNFIPELEEGAERLRRDARLDEADLYRGLVHHLESACNIEVRVEKVGSMQNALRRLDRERRVLTLSEVLRRGSRNFQLAHQIGLVTMRDTLVRLAKDQLLTTEDSRALCRVALANYFAGAVLMPYQGFLDAARAERYDVELLGHRFRTSIEQVCHRLTTLRRPGNEGIPFHLVRVDIAGNISKRFSASGMRFPRFSAACPRWNVHAAFLTPGMIRVQVSRMPDGNTYFCVAHTLRKDAAGFHSPHPVQAIELGCRIDHARKMVYADGIDLESAESAVPIGTTCRLCSRAECEQRAFPAVQRPIHLDEDVRGMSFFAPANGKER